MSGAERSGWLSLEGQRVHFLEAGAGPTLVLVHGSPLSSASFRRQIAALAARFHVVAPDLLGFGRSTAPPDGAGFALQVAARPPGERAGPPHAPAR